MTVVTANRPLSFLLMVCIATMPLIQTANAGMISTETAIELEDRQAQIGRISEMLAQDSVKNVMVRLGVDPVDAQARVESLTAAELQTLEENLNDLPAGGVGVVEVIGIVAVVLIVLELLGVTNVFTKI